MRMPSLAVWSARWWFDIAPSLVRCMTTYLCNYRWRPRAAALLNDSRVPESLRVAARVVTVTKVNDIEALTAHNEHFIQACRQGSWEMLQLILGSDFRYLDGGSGEQWEQDRYVADLRDHPAPTLAIDQLSIHLAGDTAQVSARTSRSGSDRHHRYLDSYARRDGHWVCVHACVWPLPFPAGDTVTT